MPSCRRSATTGAVIALLALASPGALFARQARISGTVIDRHTSLPVADVSITLAPGGVSLASDAAGRFALPVLQTGEYVVVFSHLGYRSRTDTLRITQPGTLDARVLLDPAPVELDSLNVDASASPILAPTGFYARKMEGLGGHFLERSEIERLRPRVFTDLFFRIPGVNMRNRSIGRELVRFNRMTGFSARGSNPDGCIPDLYIDGMIVGGPPGKPRLDTHNIVDPAEIEGIEVYAGASTPIHYKSACGVILVWTRKGG